MNPISTNQILSQIRSLNAELQAPMPAPNVTQAADAPRFGDLLKNTIETVNEIQQVSGQMKAGFENGTSDASLVEVMVATQKADLSFRAMTEVRNKLVTAYQEIMNMPV
jgi:flagellar hook-basal body complex protein FliE